MYHFVRQRPAFAATTGDTSSSSTIGDILTGFNSILSTLFSFLINLLTLVFNTFFSDSGSSSGS